MSFAYRVAAGGKGLAPAPPKPPRDRRGYSGWLSIGTRRPSFIASSV